MPLPKEVEALFDEAGGLKLAAELDANPDRPKLGDINKRYDSQGRLKATPVVPPEAQHRHSGVVDVDMTNYYYGMMALSIMGAGLAGATAYLWKRVKKNDEYLEAIREYTSRLVNETRCGNMAYSSLLDDMELEDEGTVVWTKYAPDSEDELTAPRDTTH